MEPIVTPLTATPLLRIRFVQAGDVLTRYWYHAPRVGDNVTVEDPGGPLIDGIVTVVSWIDRHLEDDVDVVVRVQ